MADKIYVKIEGGVVVDRALFSKAMPADWPDRDKYVLNATAQIGWTYDGSNFNPPPVPDPEFTPPPPQPYLFGTVALTISNGALATIELAAGLSGAIYEDGWLLVMFSNPQDAANYLVFAQTDVPTKVEQFKDTGSFELVFSDTNGDPVEPGRLDLQILMVR